MVNWDAVSAVGDLVSAIVVIITLAYLAVQVRDAKRATADQSRLYRATAVRDMILACIDNDALRMAQTRSWGVEPYYREMARKLDMPIEEVTRLDWGNGYYFWMWWGQYASTTEHRDRQELQNIVASLGGTPGMRSHWQESPLSRPLLDKDFVRFVDDILLPKSDVASVAGT